MARSEYNYNRPTFWKCRHHFYLSNIDLWLYINKLISSSYQHTDELQFQFPQTLAFIIRSCLHHRDDVINVIVLGMCESFNFLVQFL